MGIRERTELPKTAEQIARYEDLERLGIEAQAVLDAQDPRLIREKLDREMREREQNPELPPPPPTPEQRAALRKMPQHRTPEEVALLASVGITQ
jgi:hypothetical protein